MSARETVINNLAITGITVAGAQLSRGRLPTIRPAIGLAVTAGVLLAAADSTPAAASLARRFSTVIMATAVLTAGGIVASALVRYLGTPTTTDTSSRESATLSPVARE